MNDHTPARHGIVDGQLLGSNGAVDEAHHQDGARTSIALLESLRRISQAVTSNLELKNVLQSIVDAVCDHSQWQLCWINEVYLDQNLAEVVARRDRLEYTTHSRRRRWELHRIPTLDAIRYNEPIAIPDISACSEYPDYREDALLRRAVAGAIIPINTGDPTDLPRVLCVQSTLPLLSDPRQLPFLRTVTGMAALAVRSARQAQRERQAIIDSTDAVGLFSFVTERLAQREETEALLAELESRSGVSMVLFDPAGKVRYAGKSPAAYELSDSDWRNSLEERATELVSIGGQPLAGTPPAIVGASQYLPLSDAYSLTVTELPGDPPLGTILSTIRTGMPSHVHGALIPAVTTILLRDQVRRDIERDQSDDTLAALLSAPQLDDDATITRRAASIGIDMRSPMALVVFRINAPHALAHIARLRTAVQAAIQRWQGASIHVFGSELVGFIPAEGDEAKLPARIKAVAAACQSSEGPHVYIAWEGPAAQRHEYPAAWDACRTSLELALKLGRRDPVRLTSFGSYRFLLSASSAADIEAHISGSIGPLVEHDARHSADLLWTLETYLQSGRRPQETSRLLHIHVSTLRYRLDKIRTLITHDLDDEDARFDLALAIRLHRLRDQASPDPELARPHHNAAKPPIVA